MALTWARGLSARIFDLRPSTLGFPTSPRESMCRPTFSRASTSGSTRVNLPMPDLAAISASALPPEPRSEEHTSELQSLAYLVCRLLLEKKKKTTSHDQNSRKIELLAAPLADV